MTAVFITLAVVAVLVGLVGFIAWRNRDSIASQLAAKQMAALQGSLDGEELPAVPDELKDVKDLDDINARLRTMTDADGNRRFDDAHVDQVMEAAAQGPAALMQLLADAKAQAAAAQRAGVAVPHVPGPRVPSDYRRSTAANATKKRKKRK